MKMKNEFSTPFMWLVALFCFIALIIVTPVIPQSQEYHNFADQRNFFGMLLLFLHSYTYTHNGIHEILATFRLWQQFKNLHGLSGVLLGWQSLLGRFLVGILYESSLSVYSPFCWNHNNKKVSSFINLYFTASIVCSDYMNLSHSIFRLVTLFSVLLPDLKSVTDAVKTRSSDLAGSYMIFWLKFHLHRISRYLYSRAFCFLFNNYI